MSESRVSHEYVRRHATRGLRLWRNNRGALPDKRGVPVRYGLANDSKDQGEKLKSGDYIGWTQVLITPDMVGESVAVFTSIEFKAPDWKPPAEGPTHRNGRLTEYGHYLGQKRWADLVNAEGGRAGFVRDVEEGFMNL